MKCLTYFDCILSIMSNRDFYNLYVELITSTKFFRHVSFLGRVVLDKTTRSLTEALNLLIITYWELLYKITVYHIMAWSISMLYVAQIQKFYCSPDWPSMFNLLSSSFPFTNWFTSCLALQNLMTTWQDKNHPKETAKRG